MKKEKLPIPKEDEEESIFSSELTLRRIKHTHVVNETSIHNMGLLMKWQRMGKSPGFPDHISIVKKGNRKILVFTEMKRTKDPAPFTEFQQSWLKELAECTEVKTFIAYGAKEAIEQINNL